MSRQVDDSVPRMTRALQFADPDSKADDQSKKEADPGPLWDLYETWERVHKKRRGRWLRRQALKDGRHYAQFRDEGLPTRDKATKSVKKTRITLNYIGRASERFRALMTQERPSFGYTVGTSEGTDRAASKAAERFGRFIQRDQDSESDYGDWVQMSWDLGTAGIYDRWDENLGPLVTRTEGTGKFTEEVLGVDPDTGEEIVLEPSTEITDEVTERSGWLVTEILSGEEMVVPPYATPHSPIEGLIIQQYIPKWECYRRWGEEIASQISYGLPADKGASHGKSSTYPGISAETDHSNTQVALILTVFTPPDEFHPRGAQVIASKELVIEFGDNPYTPPDESPQWDRNWNPVQVLRYPAKWKDWYGRSGIDDAEAANLVVNGCVSKELLILKKLAHAHRIAPRGQLDIDSDDPAAIIEFDKGRYQRGDFGAMDAPRYPSELPARAEGFKNYLEEITGLDDALMGNSGDATSGRQQELQQRAALQRFSQFKASADRAYARSIQYKIRLLVENLDVDIQLRVTGENDRTNTEVLNTTDLSAQTDVYPVNDPLGGDPLQRSLVLQNVVTALGQLKHDPELANQFIAAHDLQDVLYIPSALTVHRDRALREHLHLQQGRELRVDTHDDHVVHIADHIAWKLSEEGEALFEANPEARAAFDAHIDEHQQAQMTQMGIDPQTGQPLQPGADQGTASLPRPITPDETGASPAADAPLRPVG